MNTRLFARIGAIGFVALALTMTALQLREEPGTAPVEAVTFLEPDGGQVTAQLRACAQMGELALASPDCRAVWAEKRRRFLGLERGPVEGVDDSAAPAPFSEPQPAKDQ